MSATLKLIGAAQSPYSRKMRAALRYRRIPYQWVRQFSPESSGHPDIKIKSMVPVVWFSHEDASQDTAMQDSTFILRDLEELYKGRSLVAADPVVLFIDRLIEDFGDEWVTKCMFHYRWAFKADADKAGTILPLEAKWDMNEDDAKNAGKAFADRQTGRLHYVGSNEVTKPLIEGSYKNILLALNDILSTQKFIMGNRPGVGDFGVFGQLVCLTQFDPTPAAVSLEETPRVTAWVESMEDVSGDNVEDSDWLARDQIKDKLGALLNEIGRTYAPYLLGNAEAVVNGAEQVKCEIDGREWGQNPFPYQAKCLGWLREEFASLSDADQQAVKDILNGTGCEIILG